MKKKIAAAASTALVVAVAAGAGALPAAHTARAAGQPFVTINGGTPLNGPMNPFNTSTVTVGGLDSMPLGFFKNGSDQNAFYPGLAAHWSQSDNGRTVTVYLQPNARWSDGSQVTAQDVYTTMELEFAHGEAEAFALGSMTVVNDKEIVFKEAPASKYNLFLHGVLSQTIVPASVFGHLLPKDILATINASQYTGSDKSLLAKQKAAQATLTALGKKIDAYTPSKDVASGPFVISAINPGEAIFSKNPYFYDASKIKVDQVQLRNYTTNQQIWNYLIGGQIYQATSGGMSTDLVKRIESVSGNIKYTVPAYVTIQLVFDESAYPYNLVKVRQALAYAINRKDVQRVGEPVGGSYSQWSTGMNDTAAQQWLTKAQLSKLNPYNYNPSKAAQLLQSAGFKKSGGHWMLPNGKPWEMTIYGVNGFNDVIEGEQIIANELTGFGISAHVSLVSGYPQYLQEIKEGKYAVGFWIGSLGPSAYGTFNRLYGQPDGYNLVGGKLTYTPASKKGGGNWLDFPQTVQVSGYGKVNVGEVTNELGQITDQAQIKHDMQELAFTSNQYMPAITLWNILQVGFVNDKYFTDFPLKNQQVRLAASGYYPPVGVWMIEGYVHPK